MELYHLKGVVKSYGDVKAFSATDITIERNKLIAIVGNSGSGKSTLLKLLAAIVKPDQGQIMYENNDITKYSKRQLDNFYQNQIDVIFQEYNLINNLSVAENLLLLKQVDKTITYKKVVAVCNQLGIEQLLTSNVNKLSGGEMQRVAIARSLLKSTNLILADEPTGALDTENTNIVMNIFRKYAALDKSVLYVTHDLKCASMADRIYIISDGQIVKTLNGGDPMLVEEHLNDHFKTIGANDER